MSDSLKDALSGIMDRAAPIESGDDSPDCDYFARIPASILSRKDLTPTQKAAFAGIDRACRGGSETDATDHQVAEACGLTLSTFQRALKALRLKGFVIALHRTCKRILRLMTRYRRALDPPPTPLTSEGSSSLQLPSPVKGVPFIHEANSPHQRSELPSPVRDTGKERVKSSKARSSSSSPEESGTTTTAKSPDTPPVPPPPPSAPETETDWKALRAEFEAAPESIRSEIRSEILAENPALAAVPSMLEKLCLVKFDARHRFEPSASLPAVIVHQVAEVLTDAELGSLPSLAFAEDPIMRSIATAELHRIGRSDVLLRPMPEKSRSARRPVPETLADRKRRNR
jgi:hypothetical protein